ncbi:MAG: class I SAM-dependent methyltransferase [Acidobacteria bacterium]|nr:MAG: class I SAM-dependent methyltransferase [Acidobacteriota bacterium]
MGFYGETVLPRLIHFVLGRRAISRLRSRRLAGVRGVVVEIGFGSGLSLPHYTPAVTRLIGIDPTRGALRLARDVLASARFPVALVAASAEHLPLADGSADAVVSAFTLCSIPDVDRALAEVGRVLRPGGELHFVEHGLSDEPRTARWQERLTPLQRRLAGGCRLDREFGGLARRAGFVLEELERFRLPGPRILTEIYAGIARRP